MAIEDDGRATADVSDYRRLLWIVVGPAVPLTLALLVTSATVHQLAAGLLAAYGALLLTFFAGTRFGLAIAARRVRDAAVCFLSVLVALAALLLPPPNVYVVLALGFAAQGAWDAFGVATGPLPEWYGRLRITSTFVLVAAMCAAFVATS